MRKQNIQKGVYGRKSLPTPGLMVKTKQLFIFLSFEEGY